MSEQHGVRLPKPKDPPSVKVKLLDTFELVVDGAQVDLPVGAQRLVALLAMRGRTGRSRLAGLLWPDTVEQRALASLRTGIWRVNQAANGLINSAHGVVELGLSPIVDVQLLVERSRAILGQEEGTAIGAGTAWDQTVERWHVVTGHRIDALEEAQMVEGELLPDWDDDWLDHERERLHQLRLHVLEATARMLTDMGRFGLALEAALAALRADALRESAHRTVISIHLAEGNIVEARRAYDQCCRTMRDELGVEPSQSTRTLPGLLMTTPVRSIGQVSPR